MIGFSRAEDGRLHDVYMTQDLQPSIDSIVLEVLSAPEVDQPRLIAEKALVHARLQTPDANDKALEQIRDAILLGVLRRLEEIESTGSGSGRA